MARHGNHGAWVVSVLISAVVASAAPSLAQSSAASGSGGSEFAFLDGFTLVVLEDGDIPAMHEAKALIESHGGRIAIMSPPSLLLGWVPFGKRDQLVGRAGIADIYYTDTLPGEVQVDNEPNQAMLNYYNAVVRGEIRAELERAREANLAAGADRVNREGDLRQPPPFDETAYLDNLESAGLDIQMLKDRGLLRSPELSPEGGFLWGDRMTGVIACSIFFVESDGSGSDPDLYTWTTEDMQIYVDRAATGLIWWTSQAGTYLGCSATFLLYYYSGRDPRCQQWVEPVLHESGWDDVWVSEIMGNFGFTSGDGYSRAEAFNTWQRSTYNANHAFCSFTPYNPNGESFLDGSPAYAYFYGPWSVLLFHSGGPIAGTFAHETGHIFGACDEYASGGTPCPIWSCTEECGTSGVVNGNCENCNPNYVTCVMMYSDWNLCEFTPGHIGWGVVTPCTPPPPPPLPAPTVTSVSQSELYQALDGTATITGSDFYVGLWVEFGGDIFVHSTTLVDSTTIEVEITAMNWTPPGWHDVTVKNRDFQSSTLTASIEVLPTTRHYFSPSGGDNFPYLNPADAATSLEDAIYAAWEGDTLFVPSMTFENFTTTIDKGALLYGAWNADFTERDLATGKTVIHPIGDVLIAPGADKAGLDGFVVENGRGGGMILPFIATIGGGVRIIDADASIANCEIRYNTTTYGSDVGAGGGIYAQGGTMDIRDTYIHDNAGTIGGGLFMYDCGGTVSGNTISANSVTQIAELPYGAGVQIVNCDSLALVDNTIEGNTGARDGGGVFIENSTNVTIEGGTIADHSVTFQGGGVFAKVSEVGLTDVVIDHNAGMLGGGISATDASSISVSECGFLWNSATVGGGVYVSGEHAEICHNLFVGNSTTGSAAVGFVSGVTTGAVQGNTLDRNAAGSGSGGFQVSSTAIDVFNNIVTNTTGHGIATSGSPQPWVGYNLVWNSTGNDYDGTTAGDGAVTGDPAFADTSAGDYHLGPHSPAIDAGRPGASYDDPDGSRGDMGWYGSHALTMEQPSYPKNLTAYLESGDVVLRWDQNPEPDVDTYHVYCDSVSGFKPSASNVVATVSAADTSANMGAPGDSTYYLVGAVDSDGYAGGYSNEVFQGPATGAGETVAYQNHLYQNVPNPFNPATTIAYELRAPSAVTLDVYDVTGRSVKRLVDGHKGAGIHKVAWDGTNGTGERVSTGIYFYRLETGSFVQTRKMLLLK